MRFVYILAVLWKTWGSNLIVGLLYLFCCTDFFFSNQTKFTEPDYCLSVWGLIYFGAVASLLCDQNFLRKKFPSIPCCKKQDRVFDGKSGLNLQPFYFVSAVISSLTLWCFVVFRETKSPFLVEFFFWHIRFIFLVVIKKNRVFLKHWREK